ncbi:MAG: DNA polymerase III subunit gamma/tau [Bdellovibrionota bacterium]
MERTASYLVISRRYRPQNFDQLIGQEALGQTLKNAVLQKRTAHAYLFTGPRGVGKTSAARILAKALRCESEDKTKVPCGKCGSCIEIQNGQSMDVIEIDAASNTGVDNIRELRESVSYSASSGQYRIFIIDEVHMLSTAAFNALLKTLEEPPPHVIFVFATTEIHKVPATILSRCQRFDFKRIPKDRIVASLEAICTSEKVEAERDALLLIAEEAEGCMRDAQSLLDQAIALSGNKLSREELEDVLGFIPRKSFFELLDNIANHDLAASLNSCTQALSGGADPKVLLGRFLATYRDLNLLKITKHLDSTDAEYKKILDGLVAKLEQDEILRGLDLCLALQGHLTAALDAQIALESLVIKLALQRPALSAQAASRVATHKVAPISHTPRSSSPTSAPSASAANSTANNQNTMNRSSSPAPAAKTSNTSTSHSALTDQFQNFLRSERPAWLPAIKSLRSITQDDKRFEIIAEADFAGKRLASADGQAVLKQCFGADFTYNVSLEGGKNKAPTASPQEIAKQKLKEAKEDVAVQSALKAFKGSISETKILDEDT